MSAKEIQKTWYVEHKGKSAGPFTIDEIAHALKKGYIDRAAKVTQTPGEWVTMAEAPEFARILRADQQTEVRGSETKTRGEALELEPLDVDPPNREKTHSGQTQTKTNSMFQEFEEHTRLSRGIKEQLENRSQLPGISTKNPEWGELKYKKNKIEGVSDAPIPPRPERTRSKITPKSSFSLKKPLLRVFEKISDLLAHPQSTKVFMGILLGSGLLAGIYFYRVHDSGAKDREERALIDAGIKSLKVGDFSSARLSLEEAVRRRPWDMSVKQELSKVLIEQKERFRARQLLKIVMDSDSKVVNKAETKSLLGLIDMIELNAATAEVSLNQALDLDPSHFPALFNLGIIKLQRGEIQEADGLFLKSLVYGGKDGAIVLALSETALALQRDSKDTKKLASADEVSSQFMKTSSDYRSELFIARAQLASAKGDEAQALAFVDAALTADPYLTQDHVHDTRLFRDRTTWGHISGWCRALQNSMQGTPRVTAMVGLCLARGGLVTEGNRMVAESLEKSKEDALVAGAAAFLALSENSTNPEALKVALAPQTNILALVLQARECEAANNFGCSDAAWKQILTLEPESVSGLVGVARSYLRNGQGALAKPLALDGFKRTSEYMPLNKVINSLLEAGVAI